MFLPLFLIILFSGLICFITFIAAAISPQEAKLLEGRSAIMITTSAISGLICAGSIGLFYFGLSQLGP